MSQRWKKYDPAWLLEASSYRFVEYPWLEGALTDCTKAREHDSYVYFIDNSNPNTLQSEWQFQESITIEGTEHGDIVIDVVEKNRIGGFELLSRVMGEPPER